MDLVSWFIKSISEMSQASDVRQAIPGIETRI